MRNARRAATNSNPERTTPYRALSRRIAASRRVGDAGCDSLGLNSCRTSRHTLQGFVFLAGAFEERREARVASRAHVMHRALADAS
jgi:hypothetical protein